MNGWRIDYDRDDGRDYENTSAGTWPAGKAGNSAMDRRFERPERSV